VAPNDLANKLYSAKLIGWNLKRQANRNIVDEAERIGKLLSAVHNQIELNCTIYHKFIEILEDYSQLEEVLKSLKSKLHECHLAAHSNNILVGVTEEEQK